MSPRRKERRVVAVAGAAALVAVGLNLVFSAVAAHRRRKRRGKSVAKPSEDFEILAQLVWILN